jgi:phosphoribosyl-AMP cyclohydrolase / phosphoribosyl-ATP pyrophosphohydrolase
MESRIDSHNFPNKIISNFNEKMTIIPTIDISQGRAVLVTEGKIKEDNGDPMERAEFLSITSDFQIVDLDRAMEKGDNSEIIKKILSKYPCYVAGGIRNFDIASEFLNNNAKRVVISTAASVDFLKQIPNNRLILALDIDQDYNLYKRGRLELTKENIFDKIDEFSEYISFITVTFHFTEGTGKGCDMYRIQVIKKIIESKGYQIRIAAAGGINSVEQVNELINMGIIPQFGLGLWRNSFTLGDIYSRVMQYEKMNQYFNFKSYDLPTLFPCVIISREGTPLGLTYTDSIGIKESVDTRRCVFFSRERQCKWIKGETSGNYQKILYVGFNCDRTALICIVEGEDFCHLNNYSCFTLRDLTNGGISNLEKILKNKIIKNIEKDLDVATTNKIIENNRTQTLESYTQKLFKNKNLQINKILEEAHEIWMSPSRENLVKEFADLFYFLTLYAISNDIEIKEIYQELNKRHHIINKKEPEMNKIPSDIKIGICLTKHCEKRIFDFLKLNGITIHKHEEEVKKGNESRSLRYEGYFDNHPEIKVLPFLIKPKDVYKFMEYNMADMVVCYQDILDNYPVTYSKVHLNDNNRESEEKISNISKICVISNVDFDLNIYRNNPDKKLRILSEYVNLTSKWTSQQKLNAKIMPVSGFTEGFLVHRLCDLVVCVVDSGDTVKANNLKIVDTIYESQLGIFVRNGMENKIQNYLNIKDS